jgi:cysteine desulfurase
VGALYVRKGVTLNPLMYGGRQEMGRRTGTENVPGIIGLGKACEITGREMIDRMAYLRYLCDRLKSGLSASIEDIRINTHPEECLPHILNISFKGIAGEKLVRELDTKGISASTGAACTADTVEVSHVMAALDLAREQTISAVRFSLGKGNNEDEIDFTIQTVHESVEKLHAMADLEESLQRPGCR